MTHHREGGVEVGQDRCHVGPVGQAQCPDERLAADGLLEAVGGRVQPCATPRHPVRRIRGEADIAAVLPRQRNHSKERRPAIRAAAAHTHPGRLAAGGGPGSRQRHRRDSPPITESSPVGWHLVYPRPGRRDHPRRPRHWPSLSRRAEPTATSRPGVEGDGWSPAGMSGRMSIRQPVSLAARRTFWPSLPMASDSW